MGRLVVRNWISVDGVMQAPGLADEDRDGGFDHGGWVMAHFEPTMGELVADQVRSADATLFGRRTYEIFAGYWPHVGEHDHDAAIAAVLERTPKYVASNTLVEPLTWRNTTVLRGRAERQVAALTQQHGSVHVVGSSQLVRALALADLVDEYQVWVFPLVLGRGKRLFDGEVARTDLELTDTATSSTGVLMHTYRRAPTAERS